MLRVGRGIARIGARYARVRPLSVVRPVYSHYTLQETQSVRARVLPLCLLLNQSSRPLHTTSCLRGKVVPFDLIDVGEAVETVQIKEWLVNIGDTVSFGDPVCEVLSDKSAVTVCVPYDGVVRKLMYDIDDVATRGKPLIMIEIEGEEEVSQPSPADTAAAAPSSPPQPEAISAPTAGAGGKVLATPAVRKMAAEKNVNLEEVKGTGRDGRILKEDILNHAQKPLSAPKPEAATVTPPTPTPPPVTPSQAAGDRVVPVKGIQAVMVKTMTASGQIPQFGYCDEVIMTKLVELRSTFKEVLQERGVSFSYLPVILKAISMALHHYPSLNATVNKECTEMTYRTDHNIGMAMDTPDGLVVPNIKAVQNKSVFEIASEITQLQELGMKGQLPPSSITGGTFSVSNIGAMGGTYARPMLLPPEVAIGAMGKIQVLPRCDSDGGVAAAHVMQVSWSADHRVIEGATMARFSNLWKSYLEEPAAMILELK